MYPRFRKTILKCENKIFSQISHRLSLFISRRPWNLLMIKFCWENQVALLLRINNRSQPCCVISWLVPAAPGHLHRLLPGRQGPHTGWSQHQPQEQATQQLIQETVSRDFGDCFSLNTARSLADITFVVAKKTHNKKCTVHNHR